MTFTVIEPPWEVHTPRGKADVLAVIDYSQESYVYFLTAARGTGDFWVYRNDKCQLFWNESTGVGRRVSDLYEEVLATQGDTIQNTGNVDIRGYPDSWGPGAFPGYTRTDSDGKPWRWTVIDNNWLWVKAT